MPVINRFRIVNFRYDNDKKYIANELFDFDGQNTLINLENGGGKSVILQLALQALIPGAELSGRKFVDYFKVNSGTAHILIEWNLDSTTNEYLLTGICASRDSEGLKYFTYTHAYSSPNECDIKRIPVVNSKKQVTGYSEFYKFLRGNTSTYRINTYARDRMGDYRKKLAENSLFREEYDAIVQINQSEGGIEKFFERAKKSRNVIERLIIPAIPSLAGEEQSILAGTFKKHLDNLKSIPLLQYNIDLYKSFLERGKELLELLGEYENTLELSSEFKLQIKIFENIMLVVAERVKEDLQRLENERTGQKEAEEELRYKFESLEIFLEEQRKLQLEEVSKDISTSIDIEKLRFSDYENKIKYANAANNWLELKKQRKRHLELKEKLQVLNVEEGELQKEYQDYIFILSQLLAGEIERLNIFIKGLITQVKKVGSELVAVKGRINAKRMQRETESNNMAVKKSEMERAEADSKRCASRFNARDMILLMNPQVALDQFEGRLPELEKEKLGLEEQKNSLLSREEDAKIKTNNLSLEKRALEERHSSKSMSLQEYERKLNILKDQAEAMGMKDDLYSGAVVAKLAALEEKAAFDLASVQVNHNAIENKKLLMNGLDYFLPDKDILTVYKYLEDNGVACVTGSLWLKKQPEAKREGLLKNNPLLPYAIIVEASMFDRVKEHSEVISKLAENYPVAIILGNDSGLSCSDLVAAGTGDLPEEREVCLDPLKGSEVYLLSSGNKRLLTSEKELETFISNLDKRLDKSTEQITFLRTDHLKIVGLKERITAFLQDHSLDWRNKLLKEIKLLTDEIAFLGKESDKLNREQAELKKARQEVENNLSGLESLFGDTKLDIAEIKEYIKAQTIITETSGAIGILTSKLKSFDEEIRMLENRAEEMSSQIRETEKKKDELSREENKLKGRLQEIQYELTVNKASKDISCSMEELEARVKAIKEKRSIGERDEIFKTIQSVETFMENYRKAIRDSGFEESDFENVFERIPESEILALQALESGTKKTLKELEEKWRSVDGDIKSLAGGIKKLTEAIVRKFGKNQYVFNIGESIESAYYVDRINELGVKIKKLNTKIDEGLNRANEANKQLFSIQQFIEDNSIEAPKDLQSNLLQLKGFEESIGLWDMMKMKAGEVAVFFKRYKDGYNEIENKVESRRIKVEKHFDSLYLSEEWRDNATVKRILSGIMKEDLYNIQYMHELFGRLFESVRRMQEAEILQLEECKQNKSELVERCLQRAQAVYEELKLVDSFSKIKIGGQNLKVIKLDMPKLEEEQGRAMMTIYLEKCIEEIGKLKEERTYDPVRIDGIIVGYMSSHILLDAVISLNDISINVYKPEHNMELSQYIPWEVVIQWSGGEKLAGFFAMFISIVSYLRFKKTGWQGSKKVIWIDNPFGQANAGHLLEYIFELAKGTNTQMICLTGLQETNIYAQFDVVYSLVHRMLSSMSIIQSKQVKSGQSVEVGYYNLKNDQMSLF